MQHKNCAFTLIEAVITIAIVITLAVILLPSISVLLKRGRQTACLANIRQIGLGVDLYMNEYQKTPEFDYYGWQGYGLSVDDANSRNWKTALIDPGYCPSRNSFFCPEATKYAPEMTNPNKNPSISAYALQLSGVSSLIIGGLSSQNGFDEDTFHKSFYRKANIPLIMEYMSVHNNTTVNSFFCDGSVRQVPSKNKAYGPVSFDTGIGTGHTLVYFREE